MYFTEEETLLYPQKSDAEQGKNFDQKEVENDIKVMMGYNFETKEKKSFDEEQNQISIKKICLKMVSEILVRNQFGLESHEKNFRPKLYHATVLLKDCSIFRQDWSVCMSKGFFTEITLFYDKICEKY